MPFDYSGMMGKHSIGNPSLQYDHRLRRMHSEDKENNNERLDIDQRKPLTYKIHTDSALKDDLDPKLQMMNGPHYQMYPKRDIKNDQTRMASSIFYRSHK